MSDSETLSYRQIQVGNLTIGMVGLEELFETLRNRNVPPDEAAIADLLQGARRHNYIPPAADEKMGVVLLREYRQFCARPAAEGSRPAGYGTWRGHPRETVPWFPTIHTELCDGCGACLRFCSFGVYAEADDGKVQVVEPFRCQIGCSACMDICKPGAIVFPPAAMLKAYRS
jgi:NAD-dependent dihydropyrimidine dehydrogenase PreA subunit